MVKINDASEIRRLVKANDSFNNQSEINDTFPKNHSLFQFYINVDGMDHNNGFYSFDDLLVGLGKISEGEYINYRDELDDAKEKIDTFEKFKIETIRELERMDKENPTLERILDEQLSEMEAEKNEIQYEKIKWEDQEQLLEHICINLRKCIYWFFFNENQQKQYPNGLLFIPKISNETIELLDSIFNQEAQMDTITNRQVDKYLTEYETVNELCAEYQRQRTELGDTIELMEATEEEDEDDESETDDESVWETESIDENENPDKSDESSESSDSTESEDEDEPLKIDECKRCGEYSYLIQQLKEKDHKITILNDIIDRQDKQIEEADDENDSDEENDWEAEYNGLKEWVEDREEEIKEERKEFNKTIVDYASRVNELIDEVRELRKFKKTVVDNI